MEPPPPSYSASGYPQASQLPGGSHHPGAALRLMDENNMEPAVWQSEDQQVGTSSVTSAYVKPASGAGPARTYAVNLLEEQRRLVKEREELRGKSAIQVLRRLHPFRRDLVPASFNLPIQDYGTSSSSTSPPQLDPPDPESAAYGPRDFSEDHLRRCRGRLIKGEKRSLAQILRGTLSPDTSPYTTRRASASALFPPKESIVPMGDVLPAPSQGPKAGEMFVGGVLKGLGVKRWAHRTLLLWHRVVRALHFDRKRSAMQDALAWDDPSRAKALMTARKLLEDAERLSWLQIDPHYGKDALTAFPLSAPPVLRHDTYNDFAKVGDTLRNQLHAMVSQQKERYTLCERAMMEHRLLKKTTKDVRWLRHMNQQGERQLQQARRRLLQAPSFTRLVELLYRGTIARSAENSAVFLSQILADSSYLQMHVLVAPQLTILRPADDDAGTPSGPAHSLAAELAPVPSHEEVQANLNALLQSVATVAGSVMNIRRPVTMAPEPSGDFTVLTADPGTNRGNSLLLRQYLAASTRYCTAVQTLDALLLQSYEVMQRHLDSFSEQFGHHFIMRMALLTALYVEPSSLMTFVREGVAEETPKVNQDSSKTVLTGADLADFLLFWLAPPQIADPTVRSLFSHALQALVNGKAELAVTHVPHHLMKRIDSLTRASSGRVDGESEEGPRSCADFTASLQLVVQESGSASAVILTHLLQHGQLVSKAIGSLPEDVARTAMLCEWFHTQLDFAQRWQEALRDINIVYASGAFCLDTKFLTFVAQQVSPMSAAVSVHMLNVYGVEEGRKLWRNIQAVVADLRQEVQHTNELVRQLRLLGGIYELITGFAASQKQLERLLLLLASAVRGPLLKEALSSQVGHVGGLEDELIEGEHSAAIAQVPHSSQAVEDVGSMSTADGQKSGSLSTGLLLFLVRSISEALEVLCGKTDEVVADSAKRVITFHHKVQDETMTVNARARALRAQMESELEPSPTLANDVRCQALTKAGTQSGDQGGQDPSEVELNASKAALEAEQLLTVSNLRSYLEIEERLLKYEKQCEELRRWRNLIQQFEAFATLENIALQVPVLNVDEFLIEKLTHFKIFWKSAREWDRSVDVLLPMRPDRVVVNEVQRHAHKILAAVSPCPPAHQRLLRQRVDGFRQLLTPLFLSQVIISLSPSRRVRILDESQRVPSQQQRSEPSRQVSKAGGGLAVSTEWHSLVNSNAELPSLSATTRKVESSSATSAGSQLRGTRFGLQHQAPPAVFYFPGELPVFPPEQASMWEDLLGQQRSVTVDGGPGSAVSVLVSVTTLRSMVRTGALHQREKVRFHYQSAIGELEVVSRLLALERFWSHRPMPLMAFGDSHIIVSVESVVQRIQEHMTVTSEVTGKLWSAAGDEKRGGIENAPVAARKADVSQSYMVLAHDWQARLGRMRENFFQLLACQEQWLKVSVLLRSNVPPVGEAGRILQAADMQFRQLMSQIVADPILAHCLDMNLHMPYVAAIQKLLTRARSELSKDLRRMKEQSPRLHFIADDSLLRLWGYSSLPSEARQVAVVNNAIPKLFPGWQQCLLRVAQTGAKSAGAASRLLRKPKRASVLQKVKVSPANAGLEVVEIVLDASEKTLALLEPVPLDGTPDIWVKALEAMVVRSFRARVVALAPPGNPLQQSPFRQKDASAADRFSRVRMEEPAKAQSRRGSTASQGSRRMSLVSEDADKEPRARVPGSARRGSLRNSIAARRATGFVDHGHNNAASTEDSEGGRGPTDPDHILCTTARIRWTAAVHSLITHEENEAISCLVNHNSAELDLLLQSGCLSSAMLCFSLECRDLLDSARADRTPLSRWVFPRVWWKDDTTIGVALDQVSLDFGWELYSGRVLASPVSEQRYVTVAQHLNACKATLLQGDLGATTTLCFAAVCGVPCYQLFVLPEQQSILDAFDNITGAATAGFWLVLHGVSDLEETLRSYFLKHLADCFAHLSACLESHLAISPHRLQPGDGQIAHAELGSYAHLCWCPPRLLFIRDTVCLLDDEDVQRLRPEHSTTAGHLWNTSALRSPAAGKVESAAAPRGSRRRRGSESDIQTLSTQQDQAMSRARLSVAERGSLQRSTTSLGEETDMQQGALDPSRWFPRATHPRVAIFLTQSSLPNPGAGIASFAVRIAAFPRPDLFICMRAGLIQAGVTDVEAATLLALAVRTFNAMAEQPTSSNEGQKSATRRLGTSEVRSVCSLVSALRTTRVTNTVGQIDDKIILCEAWLLAASAILDAAAERELLWHCTLVTFGRLPRFGENEQLFKQCLWNDTLVSRRFVKKDRDFNAMMYDEIADALKEKYSFFNSLIVQKCLAITNAILQQRHVAVVGDAGCGKSECVAVLLKAGASFRDDHQRQLFRDVKLVRINTLAHNVRKLIAMVTEAAVARQSGWSSRRQDDVDSTVSPQSSAVFTKSGSRKCSGLCAFTHEDSAEASSRVRTWLVLDGPLDPALLENVASEMPLHLLDPEPLIETPLPMRVLVETDQLAAASPALASSMAITFVDARRGPTWKDKVVAWAHQLGKTCPQYAPLVPMIRDLTAHLIDSILAFVLYYFHSGSHDMGAVPAEASSAPRSDAHLNYSHQVASFLSFFTSLLLDPVVESSFFKTATESQGNGDGGGSSEIAEDEGPPEKIPRVERKIRLLVAMASISSFGLCLYTHQRARFERFLRERVLDPSYAESLPPLYDLHFDWKTGRFEVVTELVRLGDAIIEENEILVPTAEFAAFQLRLRRLTAISVPVMLVGTAGSGKTMLLRYLKASPSNSLSVVCFGVTPRSTAEDLQGILINRLHMHNGAFIAPAAGKRFVLLIDDLHMSPRFCGGSLKGATASEASKAESSELLTGHRCGDGGEGYSALGEWMRFVLEHRGLYNIHDGSFIAVRDVSFLPSLLSPSSQALPFCKRLCRHFFVVFRETPPQASIERIFSSIWKITLRPVIQDYSLLGAAASMGRRYSELSHRVGGKEKTKQQQQFSSRQAIIKAMIDATLNTCEFAELGSTQRMHGLARIFWDIAYAFNLAPPEALRTEADIGALWGFSMRNFLLDSVEAEHPQRRRQVLSALVRNCERFFGLSVKQREEAPLGMDHLRRAPSGGMDTVSRSTRHRDSRTGETEVDFDDVAYDLGGCLRGGSSPTGAVRDGVAGRCIGMVKGAISASGARADLFARWGDQADERSPPKEPDDSLVRASFAELLHDDNMAGSMWLQDDHTLCTLLRLCNTLLLHPVVCVVGGWSHYPLITLARRVLGGALQLCTHLSGDALDRELLAASSLEAASSATEGTLPDSPSSAPSTNRPARKSLEEVHRPTSQETPPKMNMFLTGEDEVQAAAIPGYLKQARQRFFSRLIGAHSAALDSEDDEDSGKVGDLAQGLASKSTSSELTAGGMDGRVVPHPLAKHRSSSLGSLETTRTCLMIICRSASSYRSLAMRCDFVQHCYSATFMLPLTTGLQQTAVGYLSMQGSSVISPTGSLPVGEKRIVKHSPKNLGIKSNKRDSAVGGRNRLSSAGRQHSISENRSFVPLARCVELLHLQVQQTLSQEFGREFAIDFCSPSRFSMLLQAVVRFARQLVLGQLQFKALHGEALETLRALKNLSSSLSVDLRSVRVSLRLMVEDAGTLTSRVASLTSKRAAAAVTLEAAMKKKEDLDARVAAVDSQYASALSKAKHAAYVAFRDLTRLEAVHFEDLGKFRHPPLPLVKALDTVKLVVSQLRETGKQDKQDQEGGEEEVGKVADFEAVDRKTLANKSILELLGQWKTDRLMPGWLAAALERLEADKDCHPKELQPTNRAAAGMVSWLLALLDCHRVLSEIEMRRQSMGDLSQQMAAISEETGTATQESAQTEHELEGLLRQHTSIVQKREEFLREESRLQGLVDRLQFMLDSFSARERECRVQLLKLQEGDNTIVSHMGAILHLAVRSTYSAGFSPGIRAAIAQEARRILADCEIRQPQESDVESPLLLQRFLPSTLIHKAHAYWHDTYLFESAVAIEASASCCNIILDPFDLALDWLKAVHLLRYPVQRSKQEEVVLGGYNKQEEKLRLEELDQEIVEAPEENESNAPMKVIAADSHTDAIVDELQLCIRDGKVLVIQAQCLAELWHCLGPLMVSLQFSEVPSRVVTDSGSRDLSRPAGDADLGALNTATSSQGGKKAEVFNRRQQLECALPLPYRRFRLFVLVHECPWHAPFLGNAQGSFRQRQVELLSQMPSMLWSLCQVISFDTRPAHPVRRFSGILQEATSKSAALEATRGEAILAVKRLRLEVVESIMLELLATANHDSLDDEDFYHQVQVFSVHADRLAEAVTTSLEEQRRFQIQHSTKESKAVSSTLAALLSTLRHAELAAVEGDTARATSSFGVGFAGSAFVHRLDAHVDGWALAPQVLHEIALHLLRGNQEPQEALGTLLWLLLAACGEQQAGILQLMLVLEGSSGNEKLQLMWENSTCSAAAAVNVLGSSPQADVDDVPEERTQDDGQSSRAQSPGSEAESSEGSTDEESAASRSSSVVSLVESPISRPAGDSEAGTGRDGSAASQTQHRKSVLIGSAQQVAIPGDSEDSEDTEADEDEESESGSGSGDEETATNSSKKSENNAKKGNADEEREASKPHQSKHFLDMVENLGTLIQEFFPSTLVSRMWSDSMSRLRLLPPGLPILVTHEGLSDLFALAKWHGIKVKEVKARGSATLVKEEVKNGAQDSNQTWVVVDIVDFDSLDELADLLRYRSASHRKFSTKQASYPSRLFLYCSSSSKEIPRHLLRWCFCVQDTIQFFSVHKEVGQLALRAASDEAASKSKQLPADAAGLVLSLKKAALNYLSRMHPLLTLQGAAMNNEKFIAVMGGIAAGLATSDSVEDLFQCRLDDIPHWIENRVVAPARPWIQTRTLACLLRNLAMPVQRSNKQVKETIRTTLATINELLAAIAKGTQTPKDDIPFWLSLEFVRIEEKLEAARRDLASCQSALQRDRAWNEHLLAVYTSLAACRAIWADGRPLGPWCAAMQDHVQFLLSWSQSSGAIEDNTPMRLASIRDIHVIVATHIKSMKNMRFHFRLERAGEAAIADTRRTKKSTGLAGSSSGRATAEKESDDGSSSPTVQAGRPASSQLLAISFYLEGLHLIGGQWHTNRIVEGSRQMSSGEFETEMPPMILRPTRGAPPRSPDWYACPLIVASADSCGQDFAASAVAEVHVRTTLPPAVCALRAVRLVSYD